MISVSISVDVPSLADAIRFYVDDFEAALARALDAGAKQEQVFKSPEHGAVAFCSDPFGHGFCLIERKR